MYAGESLVIFGFGGHARSVADIALSAGCRSLMFIDENARDNETFLGHPVLPAVPGEFPVGWRCLVASGDNHLRARQFEAIQKVGWPLTTLIAPTATIGAGAIIGAGSVIAHHAHIGPLAKVGKGVIINTGGVVEHDCTVGDFVHVSVNSTLAGRSRLGELVFLGAGATVIDNVRIGREITVGAGGVVVESLEIPGTYVGVPAKLVGKNRT